MTNNNPTNKQYSVTLDSYNEAAALQQLLKAADQSLASSDDIDEFTITVGGIQTAFILGGPQFEALIAFVQHIADENFYKVDVNKCTVEE